MIKANLSVKQFPLREFEKLSYFEEKRRRLVFNILKFELKYQRRVEGMGCLYYYYYY